MKRTPLKRKTALRRGTTPLKRSPLKKVSKTQSKRLRTYYAKRKEYMTARPQCEVKGCTKPAADLHHKAGRGAYLNDETTFMSVCRAHHNWIHANPSAAREAGYLL